jgi:hypothetical protein
MADFHLASIGEFDGNGELGRLSWRPSVVWNRLFMKQAVAPQSMGAVTLWESFNVTSTSRESGPTRSTLARHSRTDV